MKEVIELGDKRFKKTIPNEIIKESIARIAQDLNSDLKGKNVHFIAVLNGAFMFASELMQQLNLECTISFIRLKSYDGTHSNKSPKEMLGLDVDIKNKEVVVLEDIVDSGTTIEKIVTELNKEPSCNVKVASLFFKPEVYNKEINIDYIGVEIPDDFIVGFGMDYRELGRNLKDIYTIKLN
ncbi:MAG: hypoxanthine phosphoribosyltransferase [Flavobacteriales bacterium]|nr:hypoxanthine phosphoribosyltransferase [Flavobacteriales bacterium]